MIQAILKPIDTTDKEQLEIKMEDLENSLDFLQERLKELIIEGEKISRAIKNIKKEIAEKEEEYKILSSYYYRKEA